MRWPWRSCSWSPSGSTSSRPDGRPSRDSGTGPGCAGGVLRTHGCGVRLARSDRPRRDRVRRRLLAGAGAAAGAGDQLVALRGGLRRTDGPRRRSLSRLPACRRPGVLRPGWPHGVGGPGGTGRAGGRRRRPAAAGGHGGRAAGLLRGDMGAVALRDRVVPGGAPAGRRADRARPRCRAAARRRGAGRPPGGQPAAGGTLGGTSRGQPALVGLPDDRPQRLRGTTARGRSRPATTVGPDRRACPGRPPGHGHARRPRPGSSPASERAHRRPGTASGPSPLPGSPGAAGAPAPPGAGAGDGIGAGATRRGLVGAAGPERCHAAAGRVRAGRGRAGSLRGDRRTELLRRRQPAGGPARRAG